MNLFRPATAHELRERFVQLRRAGRDLTSIPLSEVLELLGRLRPLWQPGTEYHDQALALLTSPWSRRAVESALAGLALGMTPELVQAGLTRELGRIDLLDAWEPDPWGVGHVRGYPLGVVAQILAGNVFLGGAIALCQSLLTRNAVLLKLSREDSGFTALFAQSLRAADVKGLATNAVTLASWDSREETLNDVVRSEADGLVVWGGAGAVAAYPAERCKGRVIHYGPRLGIGLVLAGVDLEAVLPGLAWDVALWEQQACSSPRLLLVEAQDDLPARLARGLQRALVDVRNEFVPKNLSLDEKGEVLSVRELAWWSGQAEVFAPADAMDHTVLLARDATGQVPLGSRMVLVQPVANLDAAEAALAPYRAGLQTAVLAAAPARWQGAIDALVRAGVTEVAAPGAAAARFLGLPHEGDFALRRLIRLIGVDLGAGPLACPGRELKATALALKPAAE